MTEEEVQKSIRALQETQRRTSWRAKEILGFITGTPVGTAIPTIPRLPPLPKKT